MKKDEPILEVNRASTTIGFLALILFSILLLFIFSFDGNYVDTTYFPLFLPIILLATHSLLKNSLDIKFYKNYILIKNIYSKSWNRLHYENLYYNKGFNSVKNIFSNDQEEKREFISIKIENYRIKFHENDEEFKDLKKLISEKVTLEKNVAFNYKRYILIFLTLSTFCVWFYLNSNGLNAKEKENIESIKEKGYVELEGIVKSVEYTGKSLHNIHVKIYGKNFIFEPENSQRYYTDQVFKQNLIKGKTIVLYLAPNEFEKKIKKSKSLNYYDKYLRHRFIKFYGVKTESYTSNPEFRN
ncbi:MAG TPA: hypothetical protein VL022_00210 [Moheibacter sp.]|nr:hypothetical protein [Moheibacter sp.]